MDTFIKVYAEIRKASYDIFIYSAYYYSWIQILNFLGKVNWNEFVYLTVPH